MAHRWYYSYVKPLSLSVQRLLNSLHIQQYNWSKHSVCNTSLDKNAVGLSILLWLKNVRKGSDLIFKLRQGASMGGFCWMVWWLVGLLLEKSVENFLQCDWSTRFMQVILLVSHWSESVLLMLSWHQCTSVHTLVNSTSVHRLLERFHWQNRG